MKKSALLFLLLPGLLSLPAAASPETVSLLDSARSALQKHDKARAEFYLTRHLAKTAFSPDSQTNDLLKELRLEPKGFIPASWPPAVRRWFIESGRTLWGVDPSRIHEEDRRFEISTASAGEYFATLTVVPEIQSWYGMDQGLSTTRELIITGASKPGPLLAFGRSVNGASRSHASAILSLFTLRALHDGTVFFRDMDGDGKPELFLRATWIVSNGFCQTVYVYRFLPNLQLQLLKTFTSPTGSFIRLKKNGEAEVVAFEEVKGDSIPSDFEQ